MTVITAPAMLFDMAKRGRRVGTPKEYQVALRRLTKALRETSPYSATEMAQELSKRVGRVIPYDTYRKWEDEDGALIPHDLIIPFCDVTGTHPFKYLLDPESTLAEVPFVKRKSASEKRKHAGS